MKAVIYYRMNSEVKLLRVDMLKKSRGKKEDINSDMATESGLRRKMRRGLGEYLDNSRLNGADTIGVRNFTAITRDNKKALRFKEKFGRD